VHLPSESISSSSIIYFYGKSIYLKTIFLLGRRDFNNRQMVFSKLGSISQRKVFMSAHKTQTIVQSPKKGYQPPKLEQHKHYVQITGFSGQLGKMSTPNQGEEA
jgi:hypothetical protein